MEIPGSIRWISLFTMVKIAALYLVPIKSYSKKYSAAFFSKWAIVTVVGI
jgi:hypothetical protein